MTDEFVSEIRAYQPKGPYYLLGDCVGGVVAVELAQTLLEQGEEVALLVLLDTERPRAFSFMLNEIARLLERAKHIAGILRQLALPTERSRREVFSEVMHRKLRRSRLSAVPSDYDDYIYQQRVMYQQLVKKHRLKRYPGRINLIVSDDVYRVVGLLGWQGFAEGGIEIHRTPGTHQTFRAQYSREFCHRLQSCIDKARSERERIANSVPAGRQEILQSRGAVS